MNLFINLLIISTFSCQHDQQLGVGVLWQTKKRGQLKRGSYEQALSNIRCGSGQKVLS